MAPLTFSDDGLGARERYAGCVQASAYLLATSTVVFSGIESTPHLPKNKVEVFTSGQRW